jgi:hypothetical protein
MVRALGLHPARLADTEWNAHHIGTFDPNGRRGLDGLVRPLGGRPFDGRTLTARAVVGAVHDPQTMNGEATGRCQKQSPMDTFEAIWIKKARSEAKLLDFAYFNLTPL